jgi:Fe-S-cluster containining protein
MGKSIILDPYDVFRLTTGLNLTLEQLLADKIELNIVDGVILPNLKMAGDMESCAFLQEDGKCSIHIHRPGICRIFPLGRYYENHSFYYILQVDECPRSSKTEVKISKWVDTPELKQNEQFVTDWHYFLNDIEDIIKSAQDEKLVKNLNMYILNNFFVKQYDADLNFYPQFYQRLTEAKKLLELNE